MLQLVSLCLVAASTSPVVPASDPLSNPLSTPLGTPLGNPLGNPLGEFGSDPSLAQIQEQGGARPPSPKKERPRRRVVVLETGGILRGLTRPTETGDWEVKGRSGWTDVPEPWIASVELESELLDRYAERVADESMAPADLLEWTLEAGLLKEAFQLGDRLLDEHPRDEDLRTVCVRASRFVAGLPERGAEDELRSLRDLGSLGSPAVREIVVARLVTAAPRDEVLAALKEDLKSRKSGRRTFAMMAMGRLFPKEDPRGLLLHTIYDPSEEARAEAAKALAEIGAREVESPLVRALDGKSSTVRVRAAQALGYSDEPAFVEPLVDRLYTLKRSVPQSGGGGAGPPHAHIFVGRQTAYIQDFDVEVAQFASVADPVVNTLLEGSVLDVGVIGVDQVVDVRAERRAVLDALRRLTRHDAGKKAKDWLGWWESDASKAYRNGGEDAPESGRR